MTLTRTLVVLIILGAYLNTLNCTKVAPSSDVTSNSPTTAFAPQHGEGKNRMKRNIFNLYFMIVECTKCSAWDLLGYGNYCGSGGSGTPVNDIDRCCQKHDNCYDYVINRYDCWLFNVYVWPYQWTTYAGTPYCTSINRCRREICNCDKKLTECLNRSGCPLAKM